MIYVLCATAAAPSLSAAIYQIMRPPHTRDERDVSAYYCEWLVGPDPAWSVLALPESEHIPVHVEADGALLQQMLAAFVADAALTQEEADGIVAAVQAAAGSTIAVAEFVPASWQPYVMDREAAIAAGYISQPEQQEA